MRKLILVLVGLVIGVAVQEVQAENKYDDVRKHSKELFQELENLNYRPENGVGVVKNANIAHEQSNDLAALEYLYENTANGEGKKTIRKKIARTILLDEKTMSILQQPSEIAMHANTWTIAAKSDGKKVKGSIVGKDGKKSQFDFLVPIQ